MSKSSLTFNVFYKDEDGETMKRKIESKNDYAAFKKEVLKKCSEFFGDNKNKQIIFHLRKEIANCKIKFFYNEETYSYILQANKDDDSIRVNLEEQFGEFPEYTLNPLTKGLLNLIETKSKELKKYILTKCSMPVMSDKQAFYEQQNKIEQQEIQHKNIICKCCLEKDIQGVRYLCAECLNYNICESCEHKKKYSHPKDHLFIRINKPIELGQNYGCVFPENGFLIRLSKEKTNNICVKVLNVGDDNLKGCMLCSVGFGKMYVGGKKVVVKQDVNKGEIVDVNVELNAQGKGMFETKWRLFSQNGLPFGDVFKCKVEVVDM